LSSGPHSRGFLVGLLSPPPLRVKRMPFAVNQGLSPLQTASNGNSAMSDFQRLSPLQTALNGNPTMSDFQRLSPLQTAINGNPAMSDFPRLLPLQTALNGNPAMNDFQTATGPPGGFALAGRGRRGQNGRIVRRVLASIPSALSVVPALDGEGAKIF